MNWLKSTKFLPKFIHSITTDKLTLSEQINIFRTISNFLQNGFTLSEALDFCLTMNGHPHSNYLVIVKKIKSELLKGVSFSKSLKSFVADDVYYQILIAEQHGDLIVTLNEISRFLRAKNRQKNKLFSLLAYPIFLLILLIGIIIAIHSFITPQLQSSGSGDPHHFELIFVILAGIILSFIMILIVRKYRALDVVQRINVLLRIPLLRRIIRYYYAYYLSSNLSMMINCGMNIQQIINFICNMGGHSLLSRLGNEIKQLINQGGNEHELLTKYHFIPLKMMMLINGGDSSRVLAHKLRIYSSLCFNKMFKMSSRLIACLQPLMFLVIGIIIVSTYLSMLLPMYNSIKGVY